jgi:hypothetical protein
MDRLKRRKLCPLDTYNVPTHCINLPKEDLAAYQKQAMGGGTALNLLHEQGSAVCARSTTAGEPENGPVNKPQREKYV